MIYGNNAGDTIVDIYFKSGEEVEVNAFTDEGDSIPDGLADCFLAAKKNPEILTRPYPVNLICCYTVEGIEYFFDGNAVEYYITGSVSEEDMVELHFASGNDFTYEFLGNVFKELADIFPSEYIHLGGVRIYRE